VEDLDEDDIDDLDYDEFYDEGLNEE